jgi:uncharacterized protein
MPRKLFRKYLPTRDSVRQNRYLGFFGSLLQHHNLWHLHRRSVAGGVAVGLFCGLIPGPLQMLSAALLAVLFRVNLPVAVIVTWYTNPLTIVPLYIAAYALGRFVTGADGDAALHASPDWSELSLGQWLPALVNWLTNMGKPFIFGLVLLATILAVTGYFSVLAAWRLHVSLAWRKRHKERIARGKT